MRYMKTGLTHHASGLAAPGFTLFSPLSLPKTFLLNMAGQVVHEWDLPGSPSNYARLLENGNLSVACRAEGGEVDMARGGVMMEMDWEGNVLWQYVDPYQHHDFRRMDNGNLIYIAWQLLPVEFAKRVRGGMPGSEHQRGIWGDCIREVDGSGERVWEWRAWEHMEIEKYPLGPNSNRHEYAHPNTIVPLAGGDALICFRHIDLIAIVDRASGDFTWQRHEPDWGGPHDVQVLDNGNMMIFANRQGRMPAGSKVVEFERAGGETIWEFQANPSHTFDSHFISGAQRLWNGNTLICEGLWGRLFEVTREGELVWEYISPYTFKQSAPGPSVGDVNFVFRAYRYPADGPEIAGRLGAAD
ncbi:MAG: arylsulfotransferase family protein [Rhodospirillales bacterium]|nr:arylsulfotransferase family protein [Rhodospirillales bacterium]